MYSSDLKHGLKLNTFKNFDHNIMLKTIQNLYCNKTNGLNMTSPFLVDNILHQQKTVNFHNQYLNQQIENYVLQQRQNCQSFERSRENSPEMDDTKMADADDERQEAVTEAKLEQDEDSKSRDEDERFNVKSEVYYNDYYRENAEKEILSIPNLNRRCTACGAFDCPPFSCKKSGIRRLEELEKRFNFNYQENSGDEAEMTKEKAFTDDIVRSCEEFSEQKKPLLKFSVSAILGDREDSVRNSNINEARIEEEIQRLYQTNSVSVQVSPPLLAIESKTQLSKYSKQDKRFSKNSEGISLIFSKEQNKGKSLRDLTVDSSWIKNHRDRKWVSSDNIQNIHKTSKNNKLEFIDSKDRYGSTSRIPLESICNVKFNCIEKPTEKNNIIQDIAKKDNSSKENIDKKREPMKEKLNLKLETNADKNKVQNISTSDENKYKNFLGVIYSAQVNSTKTFFDEATTSKVISNTEFVRSEHKVETINDFDDKTLTDTSKTTMNTLDEKDNLKKISDLLSEAMKKSVSFKLDTEVLKKDIDEQGASETEIGIADISDSRSRVNDTNDSKESSKAVVLKKITDMHFETVKVTKTHGSNCNLKSCTSKVSFKPESVTIYIDNTESDPEMTNNSKLKIVSNETQYKKYGDDSASTIIPYERETRAESEVLENIDISFSKSLLNVFGEPKYINEKASSVPKPDRNQETNTDGDDLEKTSEESDKQGTSWYKLLQDNMNVSITNSEENPEENTKKSVSKLKFTDRDSDNDSLNGTTSKKTISPDRVRRSASRVTFVDEVVSISTGNIFRINSGITSYGKTSPKSDSFERDSRGSFLDEMALFKYKLDKKLSSLMKQEASTSRCENHLYYVDEVIFRQYLGGDGRVLEGVASDTNIYDTNRRQGPVHKTVSLDRSEFGSLKAGHDDRRDFKQKGKDDKSKDARRK